MRSARVWIEQGDGFPCFLRVVLDEGYGLRYESTVILQYTIDELFGFDDVNPAPVVKWILFSLSHILPDKLDELIRVCAWTKHFSYADFL